MNKLKILLFCGRNVAMYSECKMMYIYITMLDVLEQRMRRKYIYQS